MRALLGSHSFRCELLIAAIPLMILVGHSVLYAMGKMASNGELRYMLIVAPFWALLATRGFAVLAPSPGTPEEGRGEGSCGEPETDDLPVASPAFPEQRRRWFLNPYLLAGIAAIAPVFANFGYKVLPLVQTEDWQTAARIAEWYKTSGVAKDYPNVMAAHPGVAYALDWAMLDPRLIEWTSDNVRKNPRGTILIWDYMYSIYNADRRKAVERSDFDEWIVDPAVDERVLSPGQRDRSFHGGRFKAPRWQFYFSRDAIDGRSTRANSMP